MPRPMSLIDRLLAEYERTGFLPSVGGGDHDDDPPNGDPPNGDPPKPDDKPKFEWTPEQQAEIQRIAAKEAKEAARKARADRDAEIERERKAAEADAERKKQEAAGEFESVKASLTEERDAAISERDTLQTRLDEALQAIRDDVAAAWKDTPAEVVELYEGDDDDVLAKRKHLTKSAKLIARLRDESEKPRGTGRDPKPTGHKVDVNTESKRVAPRYRI